MFVLLTDRLLDANQLAERLHVPVSLLAVNRDKESRQPRGRDVEQPDSFFVGAVDPVGVFAHPDIAEFADRSATSILCKYMPAKITSRIYLASRDTKPPLPVAGRRSVRELTRSGDALCRPRSREASNMTFAVLRAGYHVTHIDGSALGGRRRKRIPAVSHVSRGAAKR